MQTANGQLKSFVISAAIVVASLTYTITHPSTIIYIPGKYGGIQAVTSWTFFCAILLFLGGIQLGILILGGHREANYKTWRFWIVLGVIVASIIGAVTILGVNDAQIQAQRYDQICQTPYYSPVPSLGDRNYWCRYVKNK